MEDERKLMLVLTRLLAAAAFLLVFAVAASAYTIVMRGGRRIKIPDQFSVTKTTLTYQVSPDIQVTIQMDAIDVAATEAANGEQPGSLLRRAYRPPTVQTPAKDAIASQSLKAQRSVTNRELESHTRTRLESELAYERRRRELGLPSLAESRKRMQDEAEQIRQEMEESRLKEAETEGYWRARASVLRAEIAAADAEITFIRTRLDELPRFPSAGSFTVVTSVLPFGFGHAINRGFRGPFNPGFRGHGLNLPRRPIFMAPTGASPLTARVGFGGGTTRGRVFINSESLGQRPFAIAPPVLPFQNFTTFSSPFDAYDLGYERSLLIIRLDELVGHRAALRARWRELEEEARRAGAMPGWLRP